ncbi:MAG: aldolase/citrate lyase family protein [Casimicrobiaceae bacterium]
MAAAAPRARAPVQEAGAHGSKHGRSHARPQIRAGIGPNDLAATMGLFGKPGAPEVKAVIADAILRIKKTGKAAGILNYNITEARALFQAGFDFIAVNSDTSILARQSEAILAQVKGKD